MPLQLYISNSLEQLAEQVELVETDPFHPSVFVSQTEGIKHWLSLFLAKKEGVFSNFRFYKPNEFINEVAFLLSAGKPNTYDAENIRWMIFRFLSNDSFKKQFGWVAKYYAGDDLRRIQLACKVADLFDQYIVYRTEMMVNWSDKHYQPSDREKWQCELWRMIKAEVEADEPDAIDKAQYKAIVQRKLHNAELAAKLKKTFPVVHVFGLSVMTKYHLELYNSFCDHIDLRFYLLNPAPEEYWYDIVSEKEIARKWAKRNNRNEVEAMSQGNQLLSSLGMVGKELFLELFEVDDRFLNALVSGYVPRPPDSLLSTIQNDIHQNIPIADARPLPSEIITDGSLQIASNYTVSREVEVLYDYLLETIDKVYEGENIEPQDIVVMVPSIQDYIPYIKTVFGNAPFKIPYTIGDEPIENAYAITNLIIAILGVTEQEFTSENVLSLLDYDAVLRHYGIADVMGIRQAVNDCNVRFGIEGDASIETNLVSWKQGLERMVLGVAMRDELFADHDRILEPYAMAEGSFVEELLSFVRFVEDLIEVVRIANQERTLSDWAQYVLKITETFVEETRDNEEEFAILRHQLEKFIESNEMFRKMRLSFKVFNYIFKDFHLNEVQKDGYFRGRVTFCTALPMRSIPFKVIAFLGLNSESFPRKASKQGFDLIQNGPRQRGDRNIKDNDRYLFLEAFLSAKDRMFLSYIGRNIKDNTLKNPSVIVEELFDYIAKRACLPVEAVQQALVKEFPLQSYSDAYLQSNSGIRTYFPLSIGEGKRISKSKETQPSQAVLSSIELDELIQYFKHPVKWYLQKELGVFYVDADSSVSETELFDIDDGLRMHQLRNAMFSVHENSQSEFIRECKRKGMLPLASVGEVLAETEYEQTVKHLQTAFTLKAGDALPQELTCHYEVQGGRLRANKLILFDGCLIDICFSKEKRHINYLLPLYLKFLMLRACGYECSALLLTIDAEYHFTAESLSENEAKLEIERLVHIFLQNREFLLPFYPPLGQRVVEQSKNNRSVNLEREMTGGYGYADYDPYINASYYFSEIWELEAVEKWAHEIIEPMLDLVQM